MTDKMIVAPENAANAALMIVMSLIQHLQKSGILNEADGTHVYGVAANMCRGSGDEIAAQLIETVVPSTAGYDAVEALKGMGYDLKQG